MTDLSGSNPKEDTKKSSPKKKLKKIDLLNNIQLSLKFGFGTLITAKNDMDYRNAVISIHGGTELLMKYYLQSKDRLLIYPKIDYQSLLGERDDLIKKVDSIKGKLHAINYMESFNRLEYFSELPDKNRVYLLKLNHYRNSMVHYEYFYCKNEVRKLLISHIYQFIYDLLSELKLPPKDFLTDSYIKSLDRLKKSIDDEINQKYDIKIEVAKKHYFEELTDEERAQKKETEDYTKKRYDEIIKCPACENPALLRKVRKFEVESLESHDLIKRNLVLKRLSCHYCGLDITDYDQLRLEFSDKEETLSDIVKYFDCPPEEYPSYDCPPEDCPPEDCPEEDCPEEDCPEEYPKD